MATKKESAAPVKSAAKKAAPAKKPAVKKTAHTQNGVEQKVFVQFAGREWCMPEVRERVIAAYVAEGHRESSIKKLMMYVKPEEGKVFYVINDKSEGVIDL